MADSNRVKRIKREHTQEIHTTSQDRAIAEGKLVESVNSLSAQDFFDTYAPPNFEESLLGFNSKPAGQLSWIYGNPKSLLSNGDGDGDSQLKQCLDLIELTSAEDYQKSEMKWSTSKKWKEMKLPDMKYIIIRSPEKTVAGFVSFMVTYEDGYEVVYIYEIHLVPAWQGKSMGRNLMTVVEKFAQNVRVSKVMLTVFKSNDRAVDWYSKLGYREDPFSPGPRVLRNGTVKQPSYIILSKQMTD